MLKINPDLPEQKGRTHLFPLFLSLKLPAMRIFGCLLLLSTLSLAQGPVTKGNLVMEGIPEIPVSLMDKMNQYQNVRSASFEDWTPDGNSILISTRFGETSQLHKVDQPGGARKQLT